MHEGVEADSPFSPVDGEKVDADAFGEDVNGILGSAGEVVIVSFVDKDEILDVASLLFMGDIDLDDRCYLIHDILLETTKGA